MFLDQLLILLFFSIILIINFNLIQYFKLPIISPTLQTSYSLIQNLNKFYIIYSINIFQQICTFTKWNSVNYADAYWSLYSIKLTNNLHNIYFLK